MSNAVSALAGAQATGYVQVAECGLHGMITLRGDLASAPVADAIKAVTGTKVPDQRKVLSNGDTSVAWMSPDELLILLPHAQAAEAIATVSDKLAGQHHLAAEVSDARAMFRISGDHVREVIAKLCPVDMAPDAFAVGDIRRTRLAQVAAAFWMPDEQSIQIVCFRSVAQYVFDLLKNASATGSEVGYL